MTTTHEQESARIRDTIEAITTELAKVGYHVVIHQRGYSASAYRVYTDLPHNNPHLLELNIFDTGVRYCQYDRVYHEKHRQNEWLPTAPYLENPVINQARAIVQAARLDIAAKHAKDDTP